MIEIFDNISESFKARAQTMINIILAQKNFSAASQALSAFSDVCSEEQKDFLEFYLTLRMESLKNESNSDQR